MKRPPPCQVVRNSYNGDDAFRNEILAYSTVVPLLNQVTLKQPLPYPRCLYSGLDDKGHSVIILEDLRGQSFHTGNRLQLLTLSQCRAVVNKFAQLHATSMVLRIVRPGDFESACHSLNDYMFGEEKTNSMPGFFERMLRLVLDTLPQLNGDGRLSEAIAFFERHFSNYQLFSVAQRLVCGETGEDLVAICHGDSWQNNFMFRRIPGDNEEQEEVRFLDLQIMRLACPVLDLLHFLYTSTDTRFRQQYYEQLVGEYQAALVGWMERMAVPFLDQVPQCQERIDHLKSLWSLDLVRRRMHRLSLYGLAQFILLLPVLTFEAVAIVNDDTSSTTQEYDRRLRDTVLEFQEKGLLKEEFLHGL